MPTLPTLKLPERQRAFIVSKHIFKNAATQPETVSVLRHHTKPRFVNASLDEVFEFPVLLCPLCVRLHLLLREMEKALVNARDDFRVIVNVCFRGGQRLADAFEGKLRVRTSSSLW